MQISPTDEGVTDLSKNWKLKANHNGTSYYTINEDGSPRNRISAPNSRNNVIDWTEQREASFKQITKSLEENGNKSKPNTYRSGKGYSPVGCGNKTHTMNLSFFNLSKIERELKMPQGLLSKVSKKERPLPEKWKEPLRNLMKNILSDFQ